GQTRVDNPGRALAKNAGRVVKLEEVLRIRDDGETAIFKTPRYFSLGPDNSLFFLDYAEGSRLYRYKADGKLIFKLLKNGQGPGECRDAMGYFVTGDRIRVLAWIPPKIMDFSLDGRYLKESRVEEDTHGIWFLCITEGKIYGIRDEVFSSAAFRSEGIFTIPNSVYEISSDFKTWKKIYEFPVRMVIKRRRGAFRLDPIDAVIHGSTLYILHTAEYQVVAFDLRSGQVKHIITREYDRVKAKAEKATDPDPETKGIEFPDDPYVWDINRIHATAGKLWVFTSTIRGGGDDQQVDVFDEAGRFVDSVVLRFPAAGRNHRARWTLLTDDGFFIIPEQEKDGLISIGKYRIVDADLFPPSSAPGDIRAARRDQ
ncbi:MAG: 6-bladed beta-propeller, partial [Candidatus Aminicenantes bacterium]|nr:6-bladed beta-propeller [Candidatus Aminicenantes bacterium]